MTVQATARRVPFTGNGANTSFPFTFKCYGKTHLTVTKTVSGVDTLLVLDADYTVALNSNQEVSPGGTVTCPKSGSPLANGVLLTVLSNQPAEQDTTLTNAGAFFADTIEDMLDYATILEQQNAEQLSRVPKIPATDNLTAIDIPSKANRAGKFRVWDANGQETASVGSGGGDTSLRSDLADSTTAGKGYNLVGITRTAAEVTAGVALAMAIFLPGERQRYSSLADCIAVSATHAAQIRASESISAVITPPVGAKILGHGRPLITCTTNGVGALAGVAVHGLTMDGVLFKGSSDSTVPGVGYGGYSAANTGLVTLAASDNVRITNCGFDTFYNGLSTMFCTNTYVLFNEMKNFKFVGVLFSDCSDSFFNHNRVHDCTQAGGVVCYGMTGTGDTAGGRVQKDNECCNNKIYNITAWAGIMSHDYEGLLIRGNKMRNVRKGVDLGHFLATNVCKNAVVTDNLIELTATDTWGGASADHGGVQVVGFNAANQADGFVVSNNTVLKYGNAVGMLAGGIPGPIVISNAKNGAVGVNRATGIGTAISSAGFVLNGQIDNVSIAPQTLQGAMAQGGIRFINVTGAIISLDGGTVTQTNVADNALAITGSTIAALDLVMPASNSTAPYFESTSTLTFANRDSGTTSVADGGTVTHRLRTTPLKVFTTAVVSGEFVSVTARGATTFTVAIKKHDGTAGTTQSIHWEVRE